MYRDLQGRNFLLFLFCGNSSSDSSVKVLILVMHIEWIKGAKKKLLNVSKHFYGRCKVVNMSIKDGEQLENAHIYCLMKNSHMKIYFILL